jgi:hypothetical protein
MRLRERHAKYLSPDPEDPRPTICCSSPRRTNRSTIPRNCHACRIGRNDLVESDRPGPSRRSRHVPTGKDTESVCLSSCRTYQTRRRFFPEIPPRVLLGCSYVHETGRCAAVALGSAVTSDSLGHLTSDFGNLFLSQRSSTSFGRVFAQFFQKPQQCQPFVF